jgi:hypothetical protein
MSNKNIFLVAGFLCALAYAPANAQVPAITGSPTIDSPKLLEWPKDNPAAVPDLTEPTSNRLWDFHASIDECEMVLSTAGNYHMALRDLWFDEYLPNFAPANLKNWYYTTSPPISPDQIANGTLTIANLTANCVPQIAVGPGSLMNTLEAMTDANGNPVTEGGRIPIIRNQGNVILVKKGNPKNIQDIFDLGNENVRVVTSNPFNEKGSFGNYSSSIFNIAAAQAGTAAATDLFNSIFNSSSPEKKWLSGARIHHREVPWSIAHGKADAGLMFYHLAKFAVDSFPDKFEIVPLGGTAENPDPVAGNRIATLFAIKIVGNWSPTQIAARDALLDAFASNAFTAILNQYGLVRPN